MQKFNLRNWEVFQVKFEFESCSRIWKKNWKKSNFGPKNSKAGSKSVKLAQNSDPLEIEWFSEDFEPIRAIPGQIERLESIESCSRIWKKILILAQKIQRLAQKPSNWHKIQMRLKLKDFRTLLSRFGQFWAKLKGWRVLKVAKEFGKKF